MTVVSARALGLGRVLEDREQQLANRALAGWRKLTKSENR
jgi:hypothetical protein